MGEEVTGAKGSQEGNGNPYKSWVTLEIRSEMKETLEGHSWGSSYSRRKRLQTMRLCSGSDDGGSRGRLDLRLLGLRLLNGLGLLSGDGDDSGLLSSGVLKRSNGSGLLDLGRLLLNLGGSRDLALGP